MTLITFQDGKPVLRDGKVGTEQECCCGGGECDCTLCTGGSVDYELDGVTLNVPVTVENDWSPYTTLCNEGTPPNNRGVTAYAFCQEDKTVSLVVSHSWASPGYCGRVKTFTYQFDTCDSSGCPSGDATLMSTTDTGEVDDIFGSCADPAVNRSCLDGLVAPSAVTFNPLP
jgi:hypothetical protein